MSPAGVAASQLLERAGIGIDRFAAMVGVKPASVRSCFSNGRLSKKMYETLHDVRFSDLQPSQVAEDLKAIIADELNPGLASAILRDACGRTDKSIAKLANEDVPQIVAVLVATLRDGVRVRELLIKSLRCGRHVVALCCTTGNHAACQHYPR